MLTHFQRPLKRLLGSTVVLLVVMLLLPYVCLFHSQRCTDPSELQKMGLSATNVQYTQTLTELFGAKSKPQVLLMGSSLVLSPAHLLESAAHRDGYACHYLEDGLKERTGKAIAVTNVGVMAGMTSDQYSILKAALDEGKKPDYVIFGMAPRDFSDNFTTIENSPTQQMLAYCRSTRFMPESLKTNDLELCMQAHKLTVQRMAKQLKTQAVQLACRVSGHPASIASAPASKAPEPLFRTHKSVRPGDMDKFVRIYNPPNFERLRGQLAYLSDMLELCQKERIPVLLINMPITDEVRPVITAPFFNAYKQGVAGLAARYHCEFFDLDKNPSTPNAVLSNSFQDDSDFNDLVHLSLAGGKKFFNILADYLANDATFCNTFQAKPQANHLVAGQVSTTH